LPSRFVEELRSTVPQLLEELHIPQVKLPPVRAAVAQSALEADQLVPSLSELLTMSDCPRRWANEYEYGLPKRSTKELVLGSLIHAALEQGAHRRMNGVSVTTPDMLNLLKSAWDRALFDKRAWADLYGPASASLEACAESDAWMNAEIIESEVTFEADLDAARFRGRIDRIDRLGDQFRLVDYKSGRARSSGEVAKDRRISRQFGLYRLGAQQTLGNAPVRLEAHFVTAGEVVAIEKTEAQLTKDRSWAWAVGRELEQRRASGDFTAKPNDFNCPFCPYRLVCDQGQAYLTRRAKT